jgi:hypothetical protein
MLLLGQAKVFDITLTNIFQYQSLSVNTNNITWWDQKKNVQITDKDFIL